jgi:hypothetical protein
MGLKSYSTVPATSVEHHFRRAALPSLNNKQSVAYQSTDMSKFPIPKLSGKQVNINNSIVLYHSRQQYTFKTWYAQCAGFHANGTLKRKLVEKWQGVGSISYPTSVGDRQAIASRNTAQHNINNMASSVTFASYSHSQLNPRQVLFFTGYLTSVTGFDLSQNAANKWKVMKVAR